MKNKKIICAVLAVLVIAMSFMIYAQASQLSQIKQKIAERDQCLAILVNNHDYPDEYIEMLAGVNGFHGYDDMVSYLVSKGELYHIPAFTYKGDDYEYEYSETYALKGTVVYNDAIEMGVIPMN